MGIEPLVDYLGHEIGPTLVVPLRFHAKLDWPDITDRDGH